MQGKILDGLFRHRVMQELVQWSGEDTRRLDVEHPCEGSDRLPIPESLPIQSEVSALFSERSEAKENLHGRKASHSSTS
jgi:hypothetical protein